MSRVGGWLRAFGRFWYDFIVGDDWTVAAGVVVALGVTYGVLQLAPAWWLLPLASVAIVAQAVLRANRREAGTAAQDDAAADDSLARDRNEARDREPVGSR